MDSTRRRKHSISPDSRRRRIRYRHDSSDEDIKADTYAEAYIIDTNAFLYVFAEEG